MGYSTLADLKLLIPESILINLSNDVAGAVAVDAAVIAEMIDQADREIDAYAVIAGYTVPLSPVPPIASNFSARMAIWHLHRRKYFDSEIWQDDYNHCIKFLEKVSQGKARLEPETATASSSSFGYATESRRQKFTRHRTWRKF
jgi:phage gp36-like protein